MSRKIKVISVFGTRPEVIKTAPVIKELKRYPGVIESKVIISAQHRIMVDQFLGLFNIKADFDLNIMRPNQTLFDITGRCLKKLEDILKKEKPDLVLVQGDTTTAFTASLAAYYLKIKVGHIEAGLRTDDKYRPFPEEMNRRIVSVIADLHFAPTLNAKNNLVREGISQSRIHITGNTVIDSLLEIAKRKHVFRDNLLSKISSGGKKIILVTAHRRESFGKPLECICKALKEIAQLCDVEIVYPVHLNPNVQAPVNRILGGVRNIHLIEPMEYEPFVHLMKMSYIVLTDSGGVQEEAPSLGKPVLVMREVTERPEGVKAGNAKLVGMDKRKIVSSVRKLLDSRSAYYKMSKAANPYGDGKAAKRIVNVIMALRSELAGSYNG
jgi:UDP-N-acetylglucosamine 2-epimerase (non-hydrolysing)